MTSAGEITIGLEQVDFYGSGFNRPECVLCTSNGDIFASHLGSGVRHVTADGRAKVLGRPAPGQEFRPNGIALQSDGTLLVANLSEEGGVWQIDLKGELKPFLMEAEGRHLASANFVGVDDSERVWISISTRTHPALNAFNSLLEDGFIVLYDRKGTRIVTDGLASTNECRLSPDGQWLYVVETSARRVSRFKVMSDGSLTQRELFAQFRPGYFPDGIDFDAEGHLWVTHFVSNSIVRIAPEGRQSIMLEDSVQAHIDSVEAAYKAKQFSREHVYTVASKKLKPITSVAFAGADLKTVFLGTLVGDALMTFRSPVAGRRPAHWNTQRPWS